MTTPLVIVGCGGFGREVHDIVDAINTDRPVWDMLGYLDDAPSPEDLELLSRRGSVHLGGLERAVDLPEGTRYVIGIGSGRIRMMLDQRIAWTHLTPASLRHPNATTGWGVVLEPGSILCSGARLTTNIRVGRHSHVHVNSTIGHDTVLEAGVSLYPLSSVSGNCHLGEGVTMGTNSTLIQGLRVSDGVMVGAGACVVRDVHAAGTVVGVPAQPLDLRTQPDLVIPEPRSTERRLP